MQDFQTTKTDDPAQWCKEDCQVFLLLFIQNWTSILPPPTRSAVTAATPTIIGHEQIPRIRVQDTQEWHEPPWVDGFRPMPANDLISKLSKPSQSDTAITPDLSSQIAKFMGPIWGPPGCCRPQMGPMLAPMNLAIREAPVSNFKIVLQMPQPIWTVNRETQSDQTFLHISRNQWPQLWSPDENHPVVESAFGPVLRGCVISISIHWMSSRPLCDHLSHQGFSYQHYKSMKLTE